MNITDAGVLGMILSSDDMPAEDKPEAKSCPLPMTKFPKEMPYAMAYVPFQQWQKPYDSDAALQRGTIFPCLDKTFIGEEAVKNDK